MQIANPIYDVVFKYLMEDSKVAKLLISKIIDEEIETMDFLPQETIAELDTKSLTVYRLDFSARIRTKEGNHKNILIEIQKAKLASDIMRFRRYLGEHYQKKDNVYTDALGNTKPLPILSIYFLGYSLDHIKCPLIRVNRQVIDVVNDQKEIIATDPFIESLTHNSFIIQIPQLRTKYQSEVEQILSVFDQRKVEDKKEKPHLLTINESDYPAKYHTVIRRLQRAVAEPQLRKTMDVEDEILEDLQDLERQVAKKDKLIEEKDKALEEKDKAIEEKDKALEEKGKAIKEKDKALEAKDKALEENELVIGESKKAIEEKDRIIQELMSKLGQSEKTS